MARIQYVRTCTYICHYFVLWRVPGLQLSALVFIKIRPYRDRIERWADLRSHLVGDGVGQQRSGG